MKSTVLWQKGKKSFIKKGKKIPHEGSLEPAHRWSSTHLSMSNEQSRSVSICGTTLFVPALRIATTTYASASRCGAGHRLVAMRMRWCAWWRARATRGRRRSMSTRSLWIARAQSTAMGAPLVYIVNGPRARPRASSARLARYQNEQKKSNLVWLVKLAS